MTRVLVAGVSTRAAAASAARAGFDVSAVDGFGDLDQHSAVRSSSVARFTPAAAVRTACSIDCNVVAYLSSFENHPNAVAALARGRTLWGNPPAVLREVRNPVRVAAAFRRHGVEVPEVRTSRPSVGDSRWLVKPLASGGGRRIRRWRDESRIPAACYLQEHVDGTPGSVVFVAAKRRAVSIGVSRQLIGEPAFGSTGYHYCGNILAGAGQRANESRLTDAAMNLARIAAEAFDLVGVNGIDFIARGKNLVPIEINPRWCASMELVERAYGLSVFAMHAAACSKGELPTFGLDVVLRDQLTFGKAVVFARHRVVVGDTRTWLDDDSVHDVPRPGEHIAAGRPICTVFASSQDPTACRAALVDRAARVYAALVASP